MFRLKNRYSRSLVYLLQCSSFAPNMIAAGVGFTITFELEFAKKFSHSKILLLDPSETGVNTVRALTLPQNIVFISKALGGYDGVIEFGFPDNPREGSFISGELSSNYCNETVKAVCTSVNNPLINLI